MKKISTKNFAFKGRGKFELAKHPTGLKLNYKNKKDYQKKLDALSDTIDELQNKMYAHNKFGMLVIFQAMDAAGKDSTIKNVFKNVNPLGTSVQAFKRPTEIELDHDYMWRCFKNLPERGKIQVFNRSYYEEVLVVKVHPEIVTKYQKIPDPLKSDMDSLWKDRYKDISNFEEYLHNNGIVVLKFFLNLSKKEQGQRLIDRINELDKNWKFEEGDIKERGYWNDYMNAYEEMINNTSSSNAPWHIIPADDKKNMRLMVAQVIADTMSKLPMDYPESSPERQELLKSLISTIQNQDKE